VLLVALMALPEARLQTPIWIPHLPSFLRIDPALLEQMAAGNARAGTGDYRLRGVFTGALYYAEYLSIMFPFVIHFLCRQRTLWGFALMAAGTLLMAVEMYLTGSRSAMLALLMTPLTYALLVAWRVRLQNPSSITASLGVFSYPIAAISLALTVVFWRRLHVLVIGGGQHASSTNARETQWAMGWPKIASRPLGHGVGRSGDTLGYFNPGSDAPTVDTYYLTLLLDYGVLGLIFFLLLFATILWYGFKLHNRARTEEQLMMAPIMVTLFNFIVIKSVASTEGNMPFIFIMMGCVFGLASRQSQMDDAAAAAPQPVTAPRLGTRIAAPA
jgi:O-antigen ligase